MDVQFLYHTLTSSDNVIVLGGVTHTELLEEFLLVDGYEKIFDTGFRLKKAGPEMCGKATITSRVLNRNELSGPKMVYMAQLEGMKTASVDCSTMAAQVAMMKNSAVKMNSSAIPLPTEKMPLPSMSVRQIMRLPFAAGKVNSNNNS